MQETVENAADTEVAGPRQGQLPVTQEEVRASGAHYGLDVLPPFNALVELMAIVAALLALDWIWPALDINNVQPSPYWLPVLLLSLQYGTASGSLAAIVAIAAYFALATLPEQGVGENEFAYRLRILVQPILWIASAVFLGQFRMVQIAAKHELTLRVTELEAQGRTLADYANRLRGRCDVLERDIVARTAISDQVLLASLASLRDPACPLGPEVSKCLAAAVPGGTASLFAQTTYGLQRVVSVAWPSEAPWLDLIPADHPLSVAIIGARRSLSVVHDGDETILAGQGLAAVPVTEGPDAKVIGMIKVEAARAHYVTDGLAVQLQVLASALAPCLSKLISTQSNAAGLGQAQPAAEPIPLRQPASKLEVVSLIGRETSVPREPDRARPKVGF